MDKIDEVLNFNNLELARRVYATIDPLTVEEGKMLVTTGVGLGVKLVEIPNGVNIGLVTISKLPIEDDGTLILPSSPLGGLLFDMAIIYLADGSVLEVTGVKVMEGNIAHFQSDDYAVIKDIAQHATVSYIGNLE